MRKDYESAASNLYDGGWRAGEQEDLIEAYDFTEDESEIINDYLEKWDLITSNID